MAGLRYGSSDRANEVHPSMGIPMKNIDPDFKNPLGTIPEKGTLMQRIFPTGFKFELFNILHIAVPVAFTNLFMFTILTASIVMSGHLSLLEMDAVGLANSMINAFGLGIGVGLCTACDTLFSQAYGSENKKLVGTFLQRSILIISLFPMGIWVFYFNVEPFLILLGQDPEVSRLASIYMRTFSPGLIFHYNYLILARFMQSQRKPYPPLIIGLIGNLFNIVTQVTAIYGLGYRYQASAVCQAVTYFVMWLLSVIYILYTRSYEETWDGWKVEALFDWWHFSKLAIAGIGHICADVVAFEVCTFLSGIMGNTQLAIQSIMFQSESILYTAPLGIGMAVNVRIGQSMGGNNPAAAKTVYHVGLVVASMSAAASGIFLFSGQSFIPGFFTNQQEVIDGAQLAFPIVALCIVLDNLNGCCAGVLRGCGRQIVGAAILFLSYIVVGQSCGIPLAFIADLKVKGLWLGISIGLTVGLMLNIFTLYRQSWEEQVQLAQERLQQSEVKWDDESCLVTSQLLNKDTTHRRTPSQPYGCSIDIVKMPKVRTDVSAAKLKKMLIRRIIIYISVFSFFIAGVIFHICLPVEFYRPSHNSTEPYNNITDY